MPRPVVTVDLSAGRARIASTTVPVGARPGGALAVGDLVIRPLSFAERWRLLSGTAGAEGVGAAVLACAAGGAGGDAAAQVLALHLAGARACRAVPGFAGQLERLTAAGWAARDVLDADADLVDLLTEGPAGAPAGAPAEAPAEAPAQAPAGAAVADGGWTRIVLAPSAPGEVGGAAAGSVDEVLRLLERDLLDRATGPAGAAGAEPPGAARPSPMDGPVSPAPDSTARRAVAAPSGEPSPPALSPPPGAPRRSRGALPGEPAAPGLATARPTDPLETAAGPLAAALDRGTAEPGPGTPADGVPVVFPVPIRVATLPAGPLPVPAAGAPHHPAAAPAPVPAAVRPDPVAAVAGREWLAVPAAAPAAVRTDPAAPRVAPAAAAAAATPDAFDLADRIAALLDEESDLRGLRR